MFIEYLWLILNYYYQLSILFTFFPDDKAFGRAYE